MTTRQAAMAILALAAVRMVAAPVFPAARFVRTGEAERVVQANVDGSAAPVPARLVPCVNCHDLAGGGKREGAVRAADIVWSVLQTPPPAGRGYDVRRFCDAVVKGVSAGGPPLARAMPRYALAADECSAVWEYLRRLDAELPPGVTDDAIVIGANGAPATPSQDAWWRRFRETLARMTGNDGIYGRRIDVVDGYERRAAIRVLLDGRPPPAADADELVISVPAPSSPLGGFEAWQVQTPIPRQVDAVMTSGDVLGVVLGASEEAEALAAAIDTHALDGGDPAPGRPRSCSDLDGVTSVLVLRPTEGTLPALRQLDRCRRAFKLVLLEPELDLTMFDPFTHDVRLAVPWRPMHDDPLWSATALARIVDTALRSAGHRLRIARLAAGLTAAMAAEGGRDRALFDGVLLVPRGGGPPQWLSAKGRQGGP